MRIPENHQKIQKEKLVSLKLIILLSRQAIFLFKINKNTEVLWYFHYNVNSGRLSLKKISIVPSNWELRGN